jgi:hypothetical protein
VAVHRKGLGFAFRSPARRFRHSDVFLNRTRPTISTLRTGSSTLRGWRRAMSGGGGALAGGFPPGYRSA